MPEKSYETYCFYNDNVTAKLYDSRRQTEPFFLSTSPWKRLANTKMPISALICSAKTREKVVQQQVFYQGLRIRVNIDWIRIWPLRKPYYTLQKNESGKKTGEMSSTGRCATQGLIQVEIGRIRIHPSNNPDPNTTIQKRDKKKNGSKKRSNSRCFTQDQGSGSDLQNVIRIRIRPS